MPDTGTEAVYKKALHFINLASTYAAEEMHALRVKADKYFDARTPDGLRDRPNHSTYVDTVLRDTVLWLAPSLSRVFHASHDVVEIRPLEASDALKARVADKWVNQVLNVDNSAFIEDTQAMQNALMYRLGWQRFDWDEDRAAIIVRNVPTRHVLVSRDSGLNRLEWPFIGVKTPVKIDELRAEGYKVDDDLWGDNLDGMDETTIWARELSQDDLSQAGDRGLREVQKYELWWPLYKEGVWEHIVLVGREVLLRERVPEHPLVFFTPIIVSDRLDGLSISDLSFKLQDLSTAMHRAMNDYFYRLANPREEVVAGGMTEFTMPDLLKDQYDGRIRVKSPGTIAPITPPPLPLNAIELLDHYDERVSARTGVQKYQQGLAPDALNKTASGTAMVMDAASLRIEQIARTFAETGFRDRVDVILRMSIRRPDLLLKRTVTVDGQVVQLTPETFPAGYNLMVNVGVGVGNRAERRSVLGSLLEFYGTLFAQPSAQRLLPGGDRQVFSAKNIYETVKEILSLVGYNNTYAFAVDPMNPSEQVFRDPPPQPPPPSPEEQYVAVERAKVGLSREKTLYEQFQQVAEMQLKVRQSEADAADKLAQAQQTYEETALEHERMALEHQRAVEDLRVRSRELDLRERELDIKAADLILKYQDAGILPVEQNILLERQLIEVAQAVKSLEGPLSAVASPRRILRDPNGSILGTETEINGRTVRHLVQRDPDGNPVGVEMEEPDESQNVEAPNAGA